MSLASRGQVTPATRLIVVNTPHNPTGMLAARATYGGIVEIASESSAHVLATRSTGARGRRSERLPSGADALARRMSLGVMSKAFAMAGLQIGWLATRDRDLLARLPPFKDYTTLCSSPPSEMLSIVALAWQATRSSLARCGDDRRNLELVDGFFDDGPRLSWVRPQGAHRVRAVGRSRHPERRLGR